MAEWNYDQLNEEDDEENEEREGGFQYQLGTRDGLIFLIDCTKSMFDRQDEESSFELCIKIYKWSNEVQRMWSRAIRRGHGQGVTQRPPPATRF